MIRHDSGLGISKKASLASKVNAKQAKSGLELPFPMVKNNHYDLLWIGHINQKFLMFKHGAKFKVIFKRRGCNLKCVQDNEDSDTTPKNNSF